MLIDPIVVKMKRSLRIGANCTAFAVMLLMVCAIMTEVLYWIPFSAVLIPVITWADWLEHWSIVLTYYHIDSRRYGRFLKREGSRHTYSQISDIRMRKLMSDKVPVLVITFTDGETLTMPMDCENADKAKKYLLSRHSIR